MCSFLSGETQEMASADGFSTIHSTSDGVADRMCGPCKTVRSEREARKYCYDCAEYLCDLCLDHHCKLPITKNHAMIPANHVPYTTGPRLTINCGWDENEEVEFYCEGHADVICKQCQIIKHNECKTTPIQQRGSEYTSIMLDSFLSKTKLLKDKYDQLKHSCTEEKKNLQKSKDVCKKEIQSFRKELDEYIDTLEQKMLKELDQFETKEKLCIDEKITTLSTTLQILDADYDLLNDAKNDARKHVMFAADAHISKHFYECERRLVALENEALNLSISFERNKYLDVLHTEANSLGSLIITENILKTVLLGRQAKSRREVNARLAGDKTDPEITGCAVMPNRFVVICDHSNDKIKLLDSYLAIRDSLNLPCPWNVSVVDSANVIVTLVSKKQLRYLQIFPSLKAGRVLQLDKMCCGVAVSGENIYVTCHDGLGDGEVRVLDKQGNIKRRLGVTKSSGPHYITVGTNIDKIFVSDFSKDTVTCMTLDGNTIYRYQDKDLKGPKGVICDDEDNVLVCGYGSNNVQMIEAGGKKAGTILSAKDELKEPISISFRESDNTLIVGCHVRNKILAYNLVRV